MVGGRPTLRAAAAMASTASPSATPGCRLNEMVTDGNRPWWFTESGADRRTEMREGAQRNLLPLGDAHVDIPQGLRILPEFRRHFHHHVILVQRCVHGGYLALAEGVVERVVDQLRRDAEARRPWRGRRCTKDCRPRFCWSLLTSAMMGMARNSWYMRGA